MLKPKVDTCRVHYAGCDSCEYLLKYAVHIDVAHLKDFVCKNLAQGPVYALIDNSGKEDKKAGAEYVIVEQDQPTTAGSLESAKQSREYLKTLGL